MIDIRITEAQIAEIYSKAIKDTQEKYGKYSITFLPHDAYAGREVVIDYFDSMLKKYTTELIKK